jgi:ubiquinone/menaquinone biosynthesis C-methylase UbiE
MRCAFSVGLRNAVSLQADAPVLFPVHLWLSMRLSPRSVPDTYACVAPVYDVLVPSIASRARQLALDWLDVHDGEQVLEVGVGTGLAFGTLVQRNPTGCTLGIDRSPAMLRRAHRRMDGAAPSSFVLRLGDARRLRCPTDAFDAIYSGYMLDQLPHRLLCMGIREMRRVLRPGGRLVLQHMTHPEAPREQAWTLPERLLPGLLGGSRPLRASSVLREAGFLGVRRRKVVQRAFPTEVLWAAVPS